MKKILMAAVALTALGATPAMAADSVAVYTVTGNVGAICAASGTGTIEFGNLVDTDGTLNASDKTSSDASAYCNGAGTTVKISHVDLTHKTFSGTVPAGFVKVVSFVPEITVGSGGTAKTVNGDQATATGLGAFSGLTVKAKSPSVASGKPLAGDYEGSITVTLSPIA
ncbi:hypothetical protein [Sphingobium tyrosinilyticum]|uniref:Fimbrial protein n=1 Tax=Sphingobium tyrosinilyticum TaxID=2715436 RepID=A0ABV9F2C0_9SPHN